MGVVNMDIQESLIEKLNQVAIATRISGNKGKNHPAGQQRVLEILHKEDGLIQSYLAEVLDLRPSSLAELVKKLEIKNAVKRVEDMNDKRIKRVYLTEAGRRHIESVLEDKQQDDNLFVGLTVEELQSLDTLLNKMMDGWSDDLRLQTNRFMDSGNRTKHMENFQKAVLAHTGKDMNELSLKELREFRRTMFKQHMQNKRQQRHNGIIEGGQHGRNN